MTAISRRINLPAVAVALSLGTLAGGAQALDLSKPDDSYQAMLRVVGDLSGKTVYKDWDATIFASLPGQKPKPILRTIGFNAGRLIKQADGSHHWVTREVSYYVDLQTGKIIETWQNPLNGKTVDVVQVANDPVSSKFPKLEAGKFNPFAAFASLAMQFPDLAVQQLEDAVKRLGLKGAAIGGHGAAGDHHLGAADQGQEEL